MRIRSLTTCACVIAVAVTLAACGKSQDADGGADEAQPVAKAVPYTATAKFVASDACTKGVARLTQSIAENNTQNPARLAAAEKLRDAADTSAKASKWDDCFKSLDDGFTQINIDGGYVKAAKAATP